jgi:hypothetical protein
VTSGKAAANSTATEEITVKPLENRYLNYIFWCAVKAILDQQGCKLLHILRALGTQVNLAFSTE